MYEPLKRRNYHHISFEFAHKMLDAQRDFALSLIQAVAPAVEKVEPKAPATETKGGRQPDITPAELKKRMRRIVAGGLHALEIAGGVTRAGGGVTALAAHLYVLFFGMLSMVTPPVAIASFAAATLAEAAPWRTALASVRLGGGVYLYFGGRGISQRLAMLFKGRRCGGLAQQAHEHARAPEDSRGATGAAPRPKNCDHPKHQL